jgi:hypothetical protein
MKSPSIGLLLHPAFIISLFLLLVNDFFLKAAFHNWFTGKLSDFSGLITFTIFCFALLPYNRKLILLAIALTFIYWKSSFSNSFIFFLNTSCGTPVARVVDYTDLLALLPLSLLIRIRPGILCYTLCKKIMAAIACFVSIFAFSATSLPRRTADSNKVLVDKYITTSKTEKEIIDAFHKNGLQPVKKEAIYQRVGHYNHYLRPKDNDSLVLPVDSLYTAMYSRISYGSAWVVPVLPLNADTIFNLEIIIADTYRNKREIRLYSFQDKAALTTSTENHNAYYAWRKFKSPIRKKIKDMVAK